MKFEIIVATFGITFASSLLLAMNPKTAAPAIVENVETSRNGDEDRSQRTPINYPDEIIVFPETT